MCWRARWRRVCTSVNAMESGMIVPSVLVMVENSPRLLGRAREKSARRLELGRVFRMLEALLHFRPVDHRPPALQVFGPAVLVLQIVRMLPNVVDEQRILALLNRIVVS